MGSEKISAALIVVASAACSTTSFDSDFDQTAGVLMQAKQVCVENIKNGDALSEKCFPLLTDKKLLLRVSRIETDFPVRISGYAGGNQNHVWCLPEEAEAKETVENVGVKVGSKLWVTGKFTMFVGSTYYDSYTLADCNIKAFSRE